MENYIQFVTFSQVQKFQTAVNTLITVGDKIGRDNLILENIHQLKHEAQELKLKLTDSDHNNYF